MSLIQNTLAIDSILRDRRQFMKKKNPLPQIRKQKSSSLSTKARKQLLKRKKPKMKNLLNSKRFEFLKHPLSVLTITMLLVMLILPTLIVVPFSSASVNDKEEAKQSADEAVYADIEEDPSLTVSVMRSKSKQVENVPLETYVLRVVASEMPTDFELEALKAQSLAARTYIVNHLLLDGEKKGSKVTDTVQHQVYQDDTELRKAWGNDYDQKMKKLKKAVAETSGEIITYEKKPITPAFFSTSNGYTENSEDYWENELPYLRSVESPWDETSPKYLDQVIVTTDELNEKLGTNIPKGNKIDIRVSRTKSNRVDRLEIHSETFSGRDIREKLELSSSDFSIEQKQDHFIFKTRGYGHGVGMSQYGANGMAKEGKKYDDIIHYYYKGVEIRSVEDAAPALVSR